MPPTMTLDETGRSLHDALREYIEATYHISDERLVAQRRRLLEADGVIHQVPHIESTPRYRLAGSFDQLGLPDAAVEILVEASAAPSPLVFNPPYEHQAQSLQQVLSRRGSAIVTTGTGSGKTECFLLPILGRLAIEAKGRPEAFLQPAVRAILLYPMNALVNDQLGRLRLLFGSDLVSSWFIRASGRPARFARYTSRTLYPGVRTVKKDQDRLGPLGHYYVANARSAQGAGRDADAARRLVEELKSRGKWPSKPDIIRWFGPEGSRWTNRSGEFQRCVTLPGDPELLTRHEVLRAAPDVLVTNYSMLEYMLMRPLEKPLFDATRTWFAEHPEESLLVVVDEAHLYRGAPGAEVALLLRRLRDRLGLSLEQLQVICTTASFQDEEQAPAFAARLTGKPIGDFASIRGELALLDGDGPGSQQEAVLLARVDLNRFYSSADDERRSVVQEILTWRGTLEGDTATCIYEALATYPPMRLLVNSTMREATPVTELGPLLFPGADTETAARAATVLAALGSYARSPGHPEGPGLLPSRLHCFFRGLPGLWACLDATCTAIPEAERGGVAGKLYSQPVDRCECGARVFEFYTCRHCGSAYCRAYTDDLDAPAFLWTTHGQAFTGVTETVRELQPIDIFLGDLDPGGTEQPADLDVLTGRVNPQQLGNRTRLVYLPPRPSSPDEPYGEFKPCAVCGNTAAFGRSSVQDHQTKGDEPFQALVSRQVQIQQPTAQVSSFTPLAGRKALVFSDSRQTAARLAPNLQKYTTRDAVRPLLLYGYQQLQAAPDLRRRVTLEEGYLAVLLAMARLRVRLRPTTRAREDFDTHVASIDRVFSGQRPVDVLGLLIDFRAVNPPEALLDAIHSVVNDSYYGLTSLALATVEPLDDSIVDDLPAINASFESDEAKRALVTAWVGMWRGQWVRGTPDAWRDDKLKPESGRFSRRMGRILQSQAAVRAFERDWLPVLRDRLCRSIGANFGLNGTALTLALGGSWGYCRTCRSTQRPISGSDDLCSSCGRRTLAIVDVDSDPVFAARKGYYRTASVNALRDGEAPVALVSAEHTAQLNDAQADRVFSEAEENELLFQDVDLGEGKPAIDVLSCTTTMEVGIDIGALSGVALRNMPPSRANYQQRSGRAGRRGRSIATVAAFAGSQSHDEHAFSVPHELIRGRVIDPELALDNWHIARRHLLAFVLQEYVAARLESIEDGPPPSPSLFEVLGTVHDFLRHTSSMNLSDFESWLELEKSSLARRAQSWLPDELPNVQDLTELESLIHDLGRAVGAAIAEQVDGNGAERSPSPERGEAGGDDRDAVEVEAETGDVAPGADPDPETLLGRLLYKGLLPRYAFPTDVATFHVFDRDRSRRFRPAFEYTPSQSTAVALSTYAPGKRVWIGGREWTSGALYSRVPDERYSAWLSRRLYLECSTCHYALTLEATEAERGDRRDCPACGAASGLGPAQTWLRPPGFAHPVSIDETISPDDSPPTSIATRAKLTVASASLPEQREQVTDRVTAFFGHMPLLVTNRGPRDDGYRYCVRCGLIEPVSAPNQTITPDHRKPYPDDREPICPGGGVSTGITLGTDFLSDVLLISLRVDEPLTLRPQFESTRVVLRTLSEALTIHALQALSLGSGELQAEFRPALTPEGRAGLEAEIYMYDTLPGGAGFAQRVGRLGRSLLEGTLELLESCPANCSSSCYRCLRSYQNQHDHGMLDRHLAASMLRYLLTSEPPRLSAGRYIGSYQLLHADLISQNLEDLELTRDAEIDVPGFGRMTAPILARRAGRGSTVIALHHPSAPQVLLPTAWTGPAEFALEPEVLAVDELAVRRNLPWASASVLRHLGY